MMTVEMELHGQVWGFTVGLQALSSLFMTLKDKKSLGLTVVLYAVWDL